MDLSNTPKTRRDGWTAARRTQFLEALAQDGNVSAACAKVGLSREAAYRFKRRNALFARAWAAAQVQACALVGEVLGTRAIDGIEEQVWFRGEVVGTRRRYDTRLLLAHMARLDKLAEDPRAREDAERFDELLACIAGEAVPEELDQGPGELPLDRAAARRSRHAEGEALFDAWRAGACDAIDRLLAAPLTAGSGPAPWTLSEVSTSALASALLARRPGAQSGSANT